MIDKLPELRLGVGYKTSSSEANSDTTQLLANIVGMLLEALFKAERDLGVQNTTVARSLLDDYWSKMVTQKEYYSGASWEYLYPNGSPGIGLFTSLAHLWGAAPTYVMPEYLLGIRATKPGYKSWQFEPRLGILDLEEVNGTVVTPYGDIGASWKKVGDGIQAVISTNVSDGTEAILALPDGARAYLDGRECAGTRMALPEGAAAETRLHGLKL